jgi:hypothetical protein
MQQWEYATVKMFQYWNGETYVEEGELILFTSGFIEPLNALQYVNRIQQFSQEGWELVSSQSFYDSHRERIIETLWFKKPLPIRKSK